MAIQLFPGESESAALMRSLDWAATPLGVPESWPDSLRTLVPVMLTSPFPMRVQWGPDLVCLYNDGYRAIIGSSKHPAAMGRAMRDSFPEVWDRMGPAFANVLGGNVLSLDDELICLDRSGFLEECYFTASYSPIAVDGEIGGVLGVVRETTRHVVSERRLRTLRQLATRADEDAISTGLTAIRDALERNREDIPLALVYLCDETATRARFFAGVGALPGDRVAPELVELGDSGDGTWPLARSNDGPLLVTDLAARFGRIATGPYPEPIRTALVTAVGGAHGGPPLGYVVLGASARRNVDDDYRTFLDLAGEHVAAAIVAAKERREREAIVRRERAAEARIRTLFSEAPAAIAVVRASDRTFELANPHFERLFARTGLAGLDARSALPELDAIGIWSRVEEVVSKRTPWNDRELVAELVTPSGRKVRYFDMSVLPLRAIGGDVDAVVLFAVEVTELLVARKDAEEGRAERARLLASEQAARAAAELGNAAKDELLAIVSHELRNPLSAILGWTRLLRTGMLPDDKKERALETIERNAVNQSQLVEDLLDASRIIAGKMRLEVKLVTFGDVVRAALDSLKPTLDAKRLRLKAVLATDPLSLMGDASRLQQIVWNVLANAAKFTPRDGSITVVLGRVDSTLELSVTDSGEGIDPEFLPLVFDRFKLADSSSTRAHGGLGLGLSIAKNLVEMHGGTIRAESAGRGRGATFVVKLPVAPVRESDPPAASSPLWASPPELRGLSVLVVDDEPDAREMVAAVLEQCGAIVTLAGSAAEALAAFDRALPDVLLSDIGMPGEDGLELVKKVRARDRERGGAVPAASLTAYAGAEDRRRALNAGFNMHVAKPVEPADLVAIVANLARIARALR